MPTASAPTQLEIKYILGFISKGTNSSDGKDQIEKGDIFESTSRKISGGNCKGLYASSQIQIPAEARELMYMGEVSVYKALRSYRDSSKVESMCPV